MCLGFSSGLITLCSLSKILYALLPLCYKQFIVVNSGNQETKVFHWVQLGILYYLLTVKYTSAVIFIDLLK